MTDHIKTRNKLKDIPSVFRFDDLLEQSTLSEMDKTILRMHYLEHRDLRFIADTLGYAEVTIKKHHKKALSKLSKLF